MKKETKNEKGFSLIEVLVALGLIAIVLVAILSGIAASSKAALLADEKTTAESLARSQIEYLKALPYAASYSSSVPQEFIDAGFSASIATTALSASLQEITVTVSRHGDTVITLEDYKVDR